MDFPSEFILENYDQEIIEMNEDTPTLDGSMKYGSDSSDDEDHYNSKGNRFECCVMSFEEYEGNKSITETTSVSAKAFSNSVTVQLLKIHDNLPEWTLPSGQCIRCKDCSSVLTHKDTPEEGEHGKTWKCKFCGISQQLESWPKICKEDVLYVDAEPDELCDWNSEKCDRLKIQARSMEDTTVVFVIDTSGSMSLPVKESDSHIRDRSSDLSPLLKEIIQEDMEKARRTVSMGMPLLITDEDCYIATRLQTVKAGLIEQLRNMPLQQKVCLITFSTQVLIYRDCIGEPDCISSELMNSFHDLLGKGEMQPEVKPLSESRDSLEKTIKSLDENGQTALGPALTTAMAIAGKVQGSKVILCTDGVANLGLGKMSPPDPEINVAAVNKFYDKVSSHCKMNGVSVSIVSFDDCGLGKRFGSIPRETGGQLEQVKSSSSSFQKAIKEQLEVLTFAVQVDVRFAVHKDLYIIRTESPEERKATHSEFIGNINEKSKFCYFFAFCGDDANNDPRSVDPLGKLESDQPGGRCDQPGGQTYQPGGVSDQPVSCPAKKQKQKHTDSEATPFKESPAILTVDETPNANEETEYPFQIEVNFSTMDNKMATRVWTSFKKVTKSRTKAEENLKSKTVVENLLQQQSKEILSHNRNTSELHRAVKIAVKHCQDVKKTIQGNKELLRKVTVFCSLISNVSRKGRIDDDDAADLRKLENGETALNKDEENQ